MNEETIIAEYGDPSRLMASIREKADLAIRAIEEQTGKEIAQAEKDYIDEMKAFIDARKHETDKEIEKAIYIMKNRAAIEQRKLQLNAVEDFIRAMVPEAVEDYIKSDAGGYLSFLKKIIDETLPGFQGDVVAVHLCPRDGALEHEIRNFIIADNRWSGSVSIVIDESMAMGGLVLENAKEGIIYNYSIERCVSRSYDSIRKEVMTIVRKHMHHEQ
ncbi:MAG: hypothetical protein KA369_17210 [Spirochaetes bacterium]|nr:hypothetical protein [Spirochaetota bacterium]